MPFTGLAYLICIDNTGKQRELGLFIQWTDANGFEDRMLDIKSCKKVITALSKKIECPVARILSVTYSMKYCIGCLPDITLGLSGP